MTGSHSQTKPKVLTSFPLKRVEGWLSGLCQCCIATHLCHNLGWQFSQCTCLWTEHTFQRYLWLPHTDLVLSNKSKWSSWRKTDYDSLLTHIKKVFFSTQNSQNTPMKYSFSHNILFSHYVCWHFSDWPQLDILFRSPHLVEHLNNNTLKHAQSLFWSPFRLCPRVSRRIPAMMHGPSAVQV